MFQAANSYREVELRDQVNTGDPYQFAIVMVQGAITFLAQAKASLLENKIPVKAAKLSRVYDIILYVKTMLDFEGGGEIVKNIDGLLDFVLDRVVTANVNNEVKEIEDALKILTEVKECFALRKP